MCASKTEYRTWVWSSKWVWSSVVESTPNILTHLSHFQMSATHMKGEIVKHVGGLTGETTFNPTP